MKTGSTVNFILRHTAMLGIIQAHAMLGLAQQAVQVTILLGKRRINQTAFSLFRFSIADKLALGIGEFRFGQ